MFGHKIRIEDEPRRVRGLVGGRVVFDTRGARLLHEGRLPVRVYVPREDVDRSLLVPSDKRTHCPFKGDASYWSLLVDGRTVEDAFWVYEDPKPEVAAIAGYLAPYDDKLTLSRG